MSHSEHQRYIEYFQRQLLREGGDDYWRERRAWFDANRSAFAEQYLAISEKQDGKGTTLAAAVQAHQDRNDYDDFFAKQIFEPLLSKAINICEENGLPLHNPVIFANSPGFEPSPAALPSASEHVLFIGQGTYAFCNYWGKIFSSAIAEVGELPTGEKTSPEAMIEKLRQGRVLVDATQLAMHYACFDSLINFGKLEQRKELTGFRTLLVSSMEIFIVGHEIGHFLASEAYPETSGIAPGQDAKSHELDCDAVGLAISTQHGIREGNAFAYQLIGPLLFFYALRICEQVESILADVAPEKSESHPSHEERFKFALHFLDERGGKENIEESVLFALDIAMSIGSQVQLIVRDLKNHETIK